jgi:hypothetical protein
MMSDNAIACLKRYQANAAFASELEVAMRLEWTSVVRFYAALHLVNAYLIDKANVKFEPESAAHEWRKKAMKRCPELRGAPDHFRELKDISEKVRYDAGFEYAAEHHTLSTHHFQRIVAIVEPKLKK